MIAREQPDGVLCGEIVPQAMSSKGSKGSSGPAGDECANLVALNQVQAVVFQTRIARNGRGQPEEICPTLNGSDTGDTGDTGDSRPVVAMAGPAFAVRRLTPRECERLQGFPDDYTAILWGGKDATAAACPDGPRYKALGNSMAGNVMRWIGERIALVESETRESRPAKGGGRKTKTEAAPLS